VAIVAVWRLAILKMMPATPLTLLVAHWAREQMSASAVQRSGKMKTWGGSQTQKANISNSQIVFCQNSTCPFGPLVPCRSCFVTDHTCKQFRLILTGSFACVYNFRFLYTSCVSEQIRIN